MKNTLHAQLIRQLVKELSLQHWILLKRDRNKKN